MKATGIIRKVDELGRIVIPKEIRTTLEVEEGTPLEIYVEDEQVILKKYEPDSECVFCRNGKFVVEFKGKKICTNCIKEICK